jgi:plastocyanin
MDVVATSTTTRFLGIFVGGLFFLAGCSKEAPPPAAVAPATAPPPSSSSAGKIVGKAPPPTSGVPTIVVLEPKTPREFPGPEEKPVMDQVSATFGPALLFVRSGHPAEFRNSDDTLHNVHVTHMETKEPQFNVAIPTGESFQYTFKRDGFYHVGCDIHPAMSAEVFASSSPYVALAESDGSFVFEEVPPGGYVVILYAGVKRTARDVEVTNGVTTVSFD